MLKHPFDGFLQFVGLHWFSLVGPSVESAGLIQVYTRGAQK
jgi:hypothetical protein